MHNNDQSTSEQVFGAVVQQGTPQYHQDPETCTSAGVHDWCNAINCGLCAARALALSSGEFGDLRYSFLSHHLISEAPVRSGYCDDLLIQPNAFHVGNNQGDLNTPGYLRQQTFDTNKQNNSPFGPSIISDQSDQTIPSSELFPILHRASNWNNSTLSCSTDQHSAHSSIVIRQGNPVPFSGLSYHSPSSSWPFPQEPPHDCGSANGKNSTNLISTSPLFENIPPSTSSMRLGLSPYGDHSRHFCSPHGDIPYPRSAAAAVASAIDNSTRTSPSRPRFACARKKTYPVGYEPNIGKLQDRCRLSGAEDTVVDMLPAIFPAGITLEALARHRTSTEIETAQFGSGSGPVYLALLEQVMKAEGEGDVIAYRCRLCPNGGDAFAWKKPRDALRHLRRDHFGLGDCCPRW